MSENEKIKFDLLENGLDFILNGIDHILKDSAGNELKYAILHLSAGVELVFKEILRKEHWSLIFENVNLADYSKLKDGQFKSVDFETVITRLQNICEVDFEQKELTILRQLKSLRNRIEHFEFEENTNGIRSLSSKVLSVMINAIHEHILSDDNNVAKEYFELLRDKSAKFKEFVLLRNAQIKSQLYEFEKKFTIEQCPICRQSSLVLNDDRKCLFCLFTETPQKIAELYAENILGESAYIAATDGGEFPVYDCIHCEDVDCFVNKGEDGYVCFSCFETNTTSHIGECTSCGQMYEIDEDGDIGICSYCIDYMIHGDD